MLWALRKPSCDNVCTMQPEAARFLSVNDSAQVYGRTSGTNKKRALYTTLDHLGVNLSATEEP